MEEYDELAPNVDRGQYEILNRAPIDEADLLHARMSSVRSLFAQEDEAMSSDSRFRTSTSNAPYSTRNQSPVQLKLVCGALVDGIDYNEVYPESPGCGDNVDGQGGSQTEHEATPSLGGVARKVAAAGGPHLDEKQYITYEVICSTFLLGLVYNGLDASPAIQCAFSEIFSDYKDENKLDRIIAELKARGGREQLIMFLTGPAGAGKSAAIKVARRFCFEFSRSAGLAWDEFTFLFTAYTGTAAMEVGGLTICKAAFIFTTRVLTEEDKRMWRNVRVLIIDEISFMSDNQLQALDAKLKTLRDKNKPFGGYSIIFVGDFRQMEPSGESKDQLLFSRSSSQLWEKSINTVIILQNDHRFKEDPQWGAMMSTHWKSDLPLKDRHRINTRIIGENGLELPKPLGDNACYACPTNKERNVISAGNFKQHILDTHPTYESIDPPPDHTIVVEADIFSTVSEKREIKIGNSLRHRIFTTCGDDNVKYGGSKKVDPALCLYVGCYLMCVIGNEKLREKVPRGNGTLCRLMSMKLKCNPTTYRYKNMYGRKVWTVCASDVEWIEVEHVVKTEAMLELEKEMNDLKMNLLSEENHSTRQNITERIAAITDELIQHGQTRRFRMEPHTKTVHVKVRPHHMATTKMEFRCRMHQLPVNLNDATTGHKLQGMTKDVVIITSWPKGSLFTNWEYTVLSRVRTLEGLYLFEPISLTKSFAPSDELKHYFARAKYREKQFLDSRRAAMKEFYG